jgi:hypothetical protein
MGYAKGRPPGATQIAVLHHLLHLLCRFGLCRFRLRKLPYVVADDFYIRHFVASINGYLDSLSAIIGSVSAKPA